MLSADYAYHEKPYKMIVREGLKQYLLRIQTEGRSRTLAGGRYVPVEPGDIMLFPPHDPYELIIEAEPQHTGEDTVHSGDYYIFFDGPWVEDWWRQKERPRVIKSPSKDIFLTLFRQIASEQRRYSSRDEEISSYFLKILCKSIDRALSEQSGMGGRFYVANRMKAFIEEHADTPFQLKDVAAHANLSVSRAVHLFKAAFGCSIMQYALEVRLHTACERILHSPNTLEQIAESSGFASYTYFHRVFRAKFGVSPKQYRLIHGR